VIVNKNNLILIFALMTINLRMNSSCIDRGISTLFHGLKSGGRIMASARNEAPKVPRGLGVGRCSPPPGEGSGRGHCWGEDYAPSRFFFDFGAQNGMFWCILGANFIAAKLSHTHKPVSLDFCL